MSPTMSTEIDILDHWLDKSLVIAKLSAGQNAKTCFFLPCMAESDP